MIYTFYKPSFINQTNLSANAQNHLVSFETFLFLERNPSGRARAQTALRMLQSHAPLTPWAQT